MSRDSDWSDGALNSAARFLSDDGAGLSLLIAGIDRFAEDREHGDAVRLGPNLVRLRVGRYRALIEISDDDSLPIFVTHLGRAG